jgi:adenylyl-sulfate kinase
MAEQKATNIVWHQGAVTRQDREKLNGHKGACVWLTGLSGSGKSTIAVQLEKQLAERGVRTYILDGDNIRHGLNKNLGFSPEDRTENIRRIGEVAKLMTEAGLIVLCSFISPFKAERRMVRELLGSNEFIEVFVDTPIDECIKRDPKGLYRRALAGEIKNFTGIGQPYEAPENPELHLLAGRDDAAALAGQVIEDLVRRKVF